MCGKDWREFNKKEKSETTQNEVKTLATKLKGIFDERLTGYGKSSRNN